VIPLTVPEVRRLLLALAEPPERFGFRLAWSRGRRRHQALAKRCHVVRRARRLAILPPAPPPPPPLPPLRSPELPEAAWQRVRPLLPPLRTQRGRPHVDHRRMVAGMLWVERTGCPWAALPGRFGRWQSAYHRSQRWRASGLWGQILAVLDDHEAQHMAA
jgi:hypothetical protein